MSPSPQPPIPSEPLARFRDIYEALNAERGWFQGANSLRFAAMAAVCCSGSAREVASGIRKLAEELETESRWFGPLKSEIRFIVAAMLLLHGDRGKPLLDEVERVRGMFREASLRRAGSTYETIAILILRMHAERKPVSTAAVTRLGAIYTEMKRHHWWLTGPEDFPVCAVLTGQEGSAKQIGEGTERIYQALQGAGFSKGDPLQTAANILFLADGTADEIARRYRALADGFKAAGVSIWQSDYDELAILSFLDHDASEVVRRVVSRRKDVTELRPKPDHLLAFNLASSIVFLELVQLDRHLNNVTDAKALMDMQAILAAQQAAVMAASTAAVAAATASSASSG